MRSANNALWEVSVIEHGLRLFSLIQRKGRATVYRIPFQHFVPPASPLSLHH
jgi:hypothetical protein